MSDMCLLYCTESVWNMTEACFFLVCSNLLSVDRIIKLLLVLSIYQIMSIYAKNYYKEFCLTILESRAFCDAKDKTALSTFSIGHLSYSTLQQNWNRWMHQVNYANKKWEFLTSLFGLGASHFAHCRSCAALFTVAANCSTALLLTTANLRLNPSFVIPKNKNEEIRAV